MADITARLDEGFYLHVSVKVYPLLVQCSSHVVNSVFNRIILGHQVDQPDEISLGIFVVAKILLIVDYGNTAHDFIHADLSSGFQIGHPLFRSVYEFIHLPAGGIAYFSHCFEPGHFVSDRRLACFQILPSIYQVSPVGV